MATKTASELSVAEVVKAWNKSSSTIKKVVSDLGTTESALRTKIKCNKELQGKLKNSRPEWLDIDALSAKNKAAAKSVKAGTSTAKKATSVAAAPKATSTAKKEAKANSITIKIQHPRNSSASAEGTIEFDNELELRAGLEDFAQRNATYKTEPYVGGSPVLLSQIKNGDVVELRQKDSGASK
jgi:hypothetical protein